MSKGEIKFNADIRLQDGTTGSELVAIFNDLANKVVTLEGELIDSILLGGSTVAVSLYELSAEQYLELPGRHRL